MKLEQSFEVAAPVERVWQALIDVEKVAPCLPGAAVSGRNDDGSYNGTFTIKIGPTSASYAGKLTMERVDEGTHTATLQAQGTDRRGQGSAKASIVSSIFPAAENRARVEVVTDYHITGRLARFGRGGMIEDISQRLLREFAQRLQGMLAGSEDGGDGAPVARPAEAAGADGGGGGQGRGVAQTVGEQPTEVIGQPPTGGAGEQPTEVIGQTPTGGAGERPTEVVAPAPAGAGAGAGPAAPPDVPASTAPAGGELQAPPALSPAGSAPPPIPSEPVEGLSLLISVLWERMRRSPAPMAFIAGLLLAFALLGRRRRQ